jgi:hypothetical protein
MMPSIEMKCLIFSNNWPKNKTEGVLTFYCSFLYYIDGSLVILVWLIFQVWRW